MDPALQIEISARPNIQPITDAILRGDSKVQLFYDGCTVLVSGGSGFMGKHLIEKLIRSTNVKLIYILLRSKKGKSVEDRFKALLQDSVFETLGEMQPNFSKKLTPLEGDLSLEQLGIGGQVWHSIAQEIDIIFHAAASVNFEEPLRVATLTNIRGTREMIQLAKDCRKLRCMVHVSTAFSNATRARIKQDVLEQFYPAPVHPDLMIHMAESMDENRLNMIKPQLVGEWPNTYAFTKCISEELINIEGGDLPICIVRPGIVISAKTEPCPGWIDPSSAFGASGVIVGVGYGVMHVLLADGENRMDFAPVDLVNNAIIVAGWETARRWNEGAKDTKIYNLPNTKNPVSWTRMMKSFTEIGIKKYSTPNSLWYAFAISTKSLQWYRFLAWHLHYMPGYFIDGILAVLGKPRWAIKTYKKIDKMLISLSYFSINDWMFRDDNTVNLYNSLSQNDKIIYNFDMSCLDWDEMLLIWVLGTRKYIMKDQLLGTEMAVKKQSIFKILHYVIAVIYFWIFWKIISYIFCLIPF